MKKTHFFRRWIALLLMVLLVLNSLGFASEESYSAGVMRLLNYEGAVRILVSADLETIKARFRARMRGVLPVPVERMLESKHGIFDDRRPDPAETHLVRAERHDRQPVPTAL